MTKIRAAKVFTLLGLLWTGAFALPQNVSPAPLALPAFPSGSGTGGLSIIRNAIPSRPFSVVGPRGAVLGHQDGSYEVWLFPWKILSNMRIVAQVQDYPVPIDVNPLASSIEVLPESTTIVFSHAIFTVRETIFAPRRAPEGAGAMVLYRVESVRPITLTFSFTPVMQRMWPAPSDDRPSPEWVKTTGGKGFYILHLNFPDQAAAIAMPAAQPGILEPYQEQAQDYPLQFVLRCDPGRGSQLSFPLLLTVGNTAATATKEALSAQLSVLDRQFSAIYAENQKYFDDFRATHLSIDTPDESLNQAFSWAEVSIDQLRVQTTPNHDEEALTAGFVGSGDAARPGFGWFFGRDALWSLYAVNSYGGFETTRQEIEFILRRQSLEGKIMHEWSQTANLVDWKSLPYEYAAADSTPLLPMAMNDYLRISGDKAFIAAHWDALVRAWNFERTHDTDGDGIYDNSQGSGWVESWVPSMPHQEIYLAVLDEQASVAFANLARATGHTDLAAQATERATHIRAQIEKEYYLPGSDFYAFSWNGPGGTDNSATIFPSVAWWDGSYALDNSQAMMRRWASPEFSTDWGTRPLSDQVSFYDPISYHQGSVWPLFAGWVSVAEYRSGHPLSAWAHLSQNANLTWSQDLGNITELLSGEFFQPLGRSTAHQLWSSAMVISPILRGLFGLEWNAGSNELTMTPSLPAQWDHANLSHVPFGAKQLNLSIQRQDGALLVTASRDATPDATGNATTGPSAQFVRLLSRAPGASMVKGSLQIPLPAVEVGIQQKLPEPGSVTTQMKVLDEQNSAHSLTLRLTAPAGSSQVLFLRINDARLRRKDTPLRASGVQLPAAIASLQTLQVDFASDALHPGVYTEKEVTFRW